MRRLFVAAGLIHESDSAFEVWVVGGLMTILALELVIGLIPAATFILALASGG